METVREEAHPKRPLDEDDDGGNKKRLKTGPDPEQFLPTVENIKTVNDVKKWNLLPSIVYELLALFKKSENVMNSDDENQNKIDDDIKEDFKALSNQNCQENFVDNAIKHENLKEVDRCNNIIIENSNFQVSNTTKDTIKIIDKLDYSAKNATEDIPKQIPLFTKASPVKLFTENTDVNKTEQAEYESSGKTSYVKKQLTSVENIGHLSVSSDDQCSDLSTNYISKAVISTEYDSIAATSANSIYNTPLLTPDISITNTPILISTNSISNNNMFSFTNNNTLNVSENSAHKDIISKTENSFREKLLEFLNKNCVNGISGIPLTKPTPCKCNCCTTVKSLPLEQSAVYNLLFASSEKLSPKNLHSDMNCSNLPVADSSIYATNYHSENKSNIPHKFKTQINIDTPKNIWVNELTSLIIKNENTSKIYLATNTNDSNKLNPMQNILNEIHKDTQFISKNESTSQTYPATKTNDSKKINPVQSVMNKVHKTTQQYIKSHFLLCKNCKKSKYSRSDSCKCYSRSYKHKYDRY